MIMTEEDQRRIDVIAQQLLREANAKLIFLVDKNGQLIASCGDNGQLDVTSLASLTAGNIAATGGIAKLIGEKEFSILYHEGERDNLHLSIIGGRVILVVVFDQRSSLGLVRLRVKKAATSLAEVIEDMFTQSQAHGHASAMAEISDDDIEALFG
jgi:predicted regulator of Ras-like GTPase activity (Roadblock/LC7/MglB family)